jgi:hypothetical protein
MSQRASDFGSATSTQDTRFGTSPDEEEAASKIWYRRKDIKEVWCASVNWIQLAQERIEWQALMKVALKVWVP